MEAAFVEAVSISAYGPACIHGTEAAHNRKKRKQIQSRLVSRVHTQALDPSGCQGQDLSLQRAAPRLRNHIEATCRNGAFLSQPFAKAATVRNTASSKRKGAKEHL